MPDTTRTAGDYSFREVTITVDGVPLSGFAEGDDVISVEYNEDQNTMRVGADGHGIFSENMNNSAMITLKLLYGNQANDTLEALRKANATFELQITEVGTGSNWFSKKTKVANRPPIQFGAQAQESIEWKCAAVNLESDRKAYTE